MSRLSTSVFLNKGESRHLFRFHSAMKFCYPPCVKSTQYPRTSKLVLEPFDDDLTFDCGRNSWRCDHSNKTSSTVLASYRLFFTGLVSFLEFRCWGSFVIKSEKVMGVRRFCSNCKAHYEAAEKTRIKRKTHRKKSEFHLISFAKLLSNLTNHVA